MAGDARASYPEALAAALAELSSVYPAAWRAGIGYWSETAANALTYWAESVDALAAAWRRPQDAERAAVETIERLRRHLAWSGDSVERALLELNRHLVASAPAVGGAAEPVPGAATPWSAAAAPGPASPAGRGALQDALERLADAATEDAWSLAQSPHARPDVAALRSRLERLLAEIRDVALDAHPPSGGATPARG